MHVFGEIEGDLGFRVGYEVEFDEPGEVRELMVMRQGVTVPDVGIGGQA